MTAQIADLSSRAAARAGRPSVLGLGECAQIEASPAHGDLLKAQRLIKAHLAGSAWREAATPQDVDVVGYCRKPEPEPRFAG